MNFWLSWCMRCNWMNICDSASAIDQDLSCLFVNAVRHFICHVWYVILKTSAVNNIFICVSSLSFNLITFLVRLFVFDLNTELFQQAFSLLVTTIVGWQQCITSEAYTNSLVWISLLQVPSCLKTSWTCTNTKDRWCFSNGRSDISKLLFSLLKCTQVFWLVSPWSTVTCTSCKYENIKADLL